MWIKTSLLYLLWPASFALAGGLELGEFQEKMRQHLKSLSGKTTASVQVEVLGKGTELFSHQGEKFLVPASNAKLITSLAALDRLGPAHSFTTSVIQKGGDLVIVGGGDPYLVSERLWMLARSVARAGVKKADAIKVDESGFTANYRGLIEFEKSGEPFTAIVSPAGFNFNSLEVHVIPGKGERPRVELGPVPHGYATLRNEVRQSGGRGKNLSIRPLTAKDGKEEFVISGNIGREAESVILYATVAQPAAYLGHAFAALLRAEGVAVQKDFGGVVNGAGKGGEVVASLESPPLLDLVRLLNTYSNNFMSEAVFLSVGAAGGSASAEKSRDAVSSYLRRHSSCSGAKMENGSGLAWGTSLSSRCLVETLQRAYRDFRVFADLLGSLPVGGQTGSLKSRFRGQTGGFDPWKVRAKTGTLWSRQAVSSLVGVTSTASGEAVIFSLIENDQRNDAGLVKGLKDWEDRCVEYIQQLRL